MSATVERALEALRLLAGEPMLATELAARLGVHESTVSRLIQVLERERFVKREEDRRIRLGSALFSLAQRSLDALDIRRIAAVHLARLGAVTGHTIHLGEYEAGEVLYLDKVESRRPLRMYSRIGAIAPLYCTAVAKAIVAFLPEATQESLAAGITYVRHTERTITSPQAFLADLRETRERGYAMDMREHERSIECIAAPIRDASSAVHHSVSITVPVTEDSSLDDLVPLLLDAAARISSDLGWSGTPPATMQPTA